MYCNPCCKWTPSDDNREIDLPVCLIWLNNFIQHRKWFTCVLQSLIWLNKFIQERKWFTCVLQPLIWLNNFIQQRKRLTCLLQPLIRLNKFIQKRKRLTCVLQPLIWLKNIPVQHLRSERTCVFPSTVPTGPLQVSVSVSLTVQVVTPLGVANKLMAPGVTERHRPEEGHSDHPEVH